MNQADLAAATLGLVELFEHLGIGYYVGGSVASSAHGLARTTLDIDIVANIHKDAIAPLVIALKPNYYIDEEMIEDAVIQGASFNIIHLETMLKLDIFLPKTSFDLRAMQRSETLPFHEKRTLQFASSEDTVLHKLYWYRLGDEGSQRQWNDILGILKVKKEDLDLVYLRQIAKDLGVTDLLEKVLGDAGFWELGV